MVLTAVSVYSPDREWQTLLIVSIVVGLVNLPCVGTWLMLGQQLSRILTSSRRLKWFNATMALLLVGSLYPVLATV